MADELQFDKAEYGGAAPTASACTSCNQPLRTHYYELNGQVICAGCKVKIERERNAGSRFTRFARATLFGLLAAAVGTAIWYGVRKATGYELGLIAIVVGLMVGGAVRMGSRSRGGWAYQALAVFLTYASIASNYVPEIFQALRQAQPTQQAAAPGGSASPVPADADATRQAPSSQPAPVQQMGAGAAAVGLAIAVVLLFVLAFAAPFLGGLQNIMGIVIIGIALYEAWKINRRTPYALNGPFRIGTVARPTATAPEAPPPPIEP